MNSDVEQCIRQKIPWSKLPNNVKMSLANSQKEYDKAIVTFSIKNQLRYKGNLVRHVRKDEEQRYYEELLAYSRASLLLYPYHLSDIMVKGLRVTPFQYYTKVLENIMENERSYDSLPNFTAADCLRLLGIGRNEYIDLMNQCRSSRKLFRRKNVKDLLPVKPIDINVEPWWLVEIGCIVEDDIKIVSQAEKQVIDKLIDVGKPQRAGDLDHNLVHSLYKKGLVYLEVPIDEDDYIVVPPLEGFVMNRVLGDYFETLLYKIFVSIDERTSVGELANVLQIDASSVKQAVSLYCRFGFARKKVPECDDWHPTWNPAQTKPKSSPSNDVPCFTKVYAGDQTSEEGDSNINQTKRIAFLFDSTLTAFLMMGNLSPGLKSHAVTMFEVGKLTDESMDSFLCELEKVSTVRDESEGEARRYFEHALVLRSTVQALRRSSGLDLVRYESLQSLDKPTLSRLIKKNYSLLVSMAPLSGEVVPLISSSPPHLGPPCPLSNTPWFKLFVYSVTSSGPPSILFSRGERVNRVPKVFRSCDKVLLTSWSHDPTVVPTSNLLYSLNDALTYSPVLVQAYGNAGVPDTQLVPFPFPEVPEKGEVKGVNWLEHGGVSRLCRELDLDVCCGYLTLARAGSGTGWNDVSSTRPSTPPTRHDVTQLNLFLKPHEQSLTCTLDTPATPSSLDAWIQTISSGVGEVNIKHYSPVKEENEPMNGITSQECAEILEQELDKLTTPTHSPSPQSSPSRGECKDEVCSLGSLGGVVVGSRSDTSPLHVSEWVLLDCRFGVPLFDAYLNSHVTTAIIDRLSQPDSLEKSVAASESLTEKLTEFIQKLQDHGIEIERENNNGNKESGGGSYWPVSSLMFIGGELRPWDGK